MKSTISLLLLTVFVLQVSWVSTDAPLGNRIANALATLKKIGLSLQDATTGIYESEFDIGRDPQIVDMGNKLNDQSSNPKVLDCQDQFTDLITGLVDSFQQKCLANLTVVTQKVTQMNTTLTAAQNKLKSCGNCPMPDAVKSVTDAEAFIKNSSDLLSPDLATILQNKLLATVNLPSVIKTTIIDKTNQCLGGAKRH